ncbi:MAG: Ig-like domain-containing protein [Myxococcaceae bacterium]|nr:Ig-like domain-containing protein [Myxococcaceae bacterium]
MTTKVWVACAAMAGALVAACSPMNTMDATLELTASPRSIRADGQVSRITVTATDGMAKPGTGSVRLTSTAGSFVDGQTVTLAEGTATAEFSCNATQDMGCRGTVRVTAEWTSDMRRVEGTTSVTVTAVPDAGVDGGGGVTDAGPPDSGVVDSGVPDAGGMPDASMPDGGTRTDAGTVLALMASRPQLISGIGETVGFTGTLTTGGLPVSGATLDWTTSLGSFVGGDAGSSCSTDGVGACTVQLTAVAGVTGTTTVAARSTAPAAMASQMLRIVSVSQLQFQTVSCTQTTMNCNLMGLQGSGFNETALVRFRVLDPVGMGVPGVPVSFQLVGAPTGTSVDPMQVTDAMGLATATVRSGLTVGTFVVRATALTLTVDSPTIGVRGAKPTNRGFTLSCSRVNVSAYTVAVPPRPVQIMCNVGLTDRYNNPVGTGTAVRLNSEAGAVPNNVATAAFMPGSSTANEGRATFTFATDQGVFPPVDVTPFMPDSLQFPFPRFAEPFRTVGPLTANPRDGLVTIIAYLQGEEDFRDNNNNGMWDVGEQYIDQGEPLLDSNDNNVWDQNEFYVDTNNNNMWDGPNGQWDATTQIWTDFRLLYTGAALGSECRIAIGTSRPPTQQTYPVVNISTTQNLSVWAPDARLNRVTAGSTLAARLVPSTRGSLTSTSNTGLDGYGFSVERRLLATSGTGDCQAGTPACSYFLRFGGWDEGLVGGVTLVGATTMPPTATIQTVQVDVTTDGIVVPCAVTGTFN